MIIKGNTVGTPALKEAYVEKLKKALNTAEAALPRSGGAMTGELSVLTPTEDDHAANKGYVDGKHLHTTVSLPAASWAGDAAPYTQIVVVGGILATDCPHWGAVYTGELETKLAQKEAFEVIDDLETADGTVTFTCFEEKPEVDLDIQIEVNR